MNNLSWFLYFADRLPALSGFIFFCGLMVFITWVLTGVLSHTEEGECNFPFHGWVERGVQRVKLVLVAITLMFVAYLIPSKETIYLIAGSEAGEAVVTSPQGQEVISDIHEVIKQQLEGLKDDE